MEEVRFAGVVKWLIRAASFPNSSVPEGTLETWADLADKYGVDLLRDAVRRHCAKSFPTPKQVQAAIDLILKNGNDDR
jgi:hypothetical protein